MSLVSVGTKPILKVIFSSFFVCVLHIFLSSWGNTGNTGNTGNAGYATSGTLVSKICYAFVNKSFLSAVS